MSVTNTSEYELGPSNWRKVPKFYTKPTTMLRDGRHDTGGGYEMIRSVEWVPDSPRQDKEDVYAAVHRLCAVAWCYPDGVTAAEIDLRGKDVHHAHPDDWSTGVEWLNANDSPNLPGVGLEVMTHGRHSEVTQAEMRSWAEDAKADADGSADAAACVRCGDAPDVAAESDDWEGVACLDCATALSDGAPIRVVD